MKISVIGGGYVGLGTGFAFAEKGHTVTILDRHQEKIDLLQSGETPIHEPGLTDILQKNLKKGRLHFTTSYEEAVKKSEVIIIAVSTPPKKDGSADLSNILSAIKSIATKMNEYKLIISKSTVPPQTYKTIVSEMKKHTDIPFDYASNPEFLQQGNVVNDCLNPYRIVIGINEKSEKAKKLIKRIYNNFESPLVITNIPTAELIKYAANSLLATDISFINNIARLCEKIGANVLDISRALRLDPRIGAKAFVDAGAGYGGSCFPKDTRAIAAESLKYGMNQEIIEATIEVNEQQKDYFIKKIEDLIEKIAPKKIAIWGLAFKGGTDDTRESIGIQTANTLAKKYPHIKISAFDPEAMPRAKEELDRKIEVSADKNECFADSNFLVITADWDEFRVTREYLEEKMPNNSIIIDGRNILKYDDMKESKKIQYFGIGVPQPK